MLDAFIPEFDRALRTVFVDAPTQRPVPGADLADLPLSAPERRHAAALMRVNHCGEVCAQALYRGQALASAGSAARQELERAAREESDHLHWTARRIAELGGRKSLLNPLWYVGSLAVGILAGRRGDAWSMGFLAETERQVGAHLAGHIARLPRDDVKSRQVLVQMKADEARHAEAAGRHGAAVLPVPARLAMKLSSKLMTTLSYVA